MKIDDLKPIIAKYAIKATHQRLVIYHYLLHTKEHPTAEKVFHELKDENPALSLATVYKTLDTFYEKGLVKKLKTLDDSVHWDGDLSFHHHFICTITNQITDYEDHSLSNLITEYLKNKDIKNFKISDIQLNIFGETK